VYAKVRVTQKWLRVRDIVMSKERERERQRMPGRKRKGERGRGGGRAERKKGERNEGINRSRGRRGTCLLSTACRAAWSPLGQLCVSERGAACVFR
jgi:hypothetical protein